MTGVSCLYKVPHREIFSYLRVPIGDSKKRCHTVPPEVW